MLNKAILVGRLTADPELHYTASGVAVGNFTLAVNRGRKSASREEETDFINIVVWQKRAEVCSQFLRKGRLAAVEGRLQIRSYDSRDGRKVKVAEVIADSVEFLDKSSTQTNDNTTSYQNRDGSQNSNRSSNRSNSSNAGSTQSRGMVSDDPFYGGADIDILDDDLPF